MYVPPGTTGEGLPSVYVIQGLNGQVDMWLNRPHFGRPNMIERVDELFVTGGAPAVVVFVDAWTSYGGSQFINSTSTGPYMDYLCDEIVPFVDDTYGTLASAGKRGLTGHSSGGYGAMVVPMLRPDIFGAFASSAGDALFEACYQRNFPDTARTLRDHHEGSWEAFWTAVRAAEFFDFDKFGGPTNDYAMGAAYSPDPDNPGGALMPFDIETGRLIPDIWELWLQWDPVRLVPRSVDALRTMKLIYVDGGRSDEWYLDLGATAVSKELTKAGIDHRLELFDGKHGNLLPRYPGHIALLVAALSA